LCENIPAKCAEKTEALLRYVNAFISGEEIIFEEARNGQ